MRTVANGARRGRRKGMWYFEQCWTSIRTNHQQCITHGRPISYCLERTKTRRPMTDDEAAASDPYNAGVRP